MKKVYLKGMCIEEVIERLKNGEVIHIDGSDHKIKMIEGVIVEKLKWGTGFGVGFTVGSDVEYYFEEEERFEINETGLYKTRDGKKAFVYRIDRNSLYPVLYAIENDICRSVTKYGFNISEDEESSCDIVSKWEE